MAEVKYKGITEKAIGAAMQVHAALQNGFLRALCQNALEAKLKAAGVCFARALNMPVHYKGNQTGERVDFLMNGKIMVKLKALTQEAYTTQFGLLTNLGAITLQFKPLKS